MEMFFGSSMVFVWFLMFMAISVFASILSVKTPYVKIKQLHWTMKSLWWWGWSFIALIIVGMVGAFSFSLATTLIRYQLGIN